MATALFLGVLVVAISLALAVEERGQLICYGDGFSKVLGGNRTTINHNLSCPECTGQIEVCDAVPQVCMWLSSREVHVLRNGTLLQSVSLGDSCSPQYIHQSRANPERVIVQCRSLPPNFYPTYVRIRRISTSEWNGNVVVKQGFDATYANSSTNTIIASGGSWAPVGQLEDFSITIASDGPEVLIHLDSELDSKSPNSISLATQCDLVTALHRSEPFGEENYLQFVVDCVRTGTNKRLVVTLNDYLEIFTEPYELLHTGGFISVNPSDPNYFLILDTSQIILVDRYNPPALKTVMNFTNPITSVSFLSDKLILVESPGNNRYLINTTLFVQTITEDGAYILPRSEAYCPGGVCPAHTLVSNRLLVVFVQDGSYLKALAYDIQNLGSAEPYVVGQLLALDFPHACFFKEGNTPFILSTTDPPMPPYATTSDTTLRPIATQFLSSGLSFEGLIALLVSLVFAAFVVLVIMVVTFVCLWHRRKEKQEKSKDMMVFSQDRDSRSQGVPCQETGDPARKDIHATEGKSSSLTSVVVHVSTERSDSPTSSYKTMSQNSSRNLTPMPQFGRKLEQTSDYQTASSHESLTPFPTPLPEHRDSIGNCVCTTAPISQQDGTFKSNQTELV